MLNHYHILSTAPHEELMGADWVEHRVKSVTFASRLDQAIQKLGLSDEHINEMMQNVGKVREKP